MPPAVTASQGSPTVQLLTDRATYRYADPVIVTIINGFSVPVYGLTGRTYCTIVTLQRNLDRDAWAEAGHCVVSGPPGWIEIPADGRTDVEVRPLLPADRPLEPGRYRAALTFQLGSTSGPATTTYSPEFVIDVTGARPR